MQRFSSFLLVLSFFFGSLRFGFVPTLVFDASDDAENICSYASGNLYGLAEEDVPSSAAVESLDISSVSAKLIDGLQHPTGDVDHISPALVNTDYIVVYLQDAYSTWYYDNEAIFENRADGTYDWQDYIHNDFFPKISEAVEKLRTKPYHDKLVYCLYNECDNGVWFGTWKDGWADFDEAGKTAFFDAWLETYDYIRRIDPTAKIGGPGYYEYNPTKLREFLTFCRDNNCLPDILIYHELADNSSLEWDLHAEERHQIEEELGIDELTTIVTEYGTMQECGNPVAMFPYIRQAEYTKTYGNIAFWRLADNLNDNLADANTPNSCWWLYRWYADMDGKLLRPDIRDLFHGDFAKAVKAGRKMRYKYLNGFGSINEQKNKIDILFGGADYKGQVLIKNLDKTNIGKNLHIRVEAVTFEGLGGELFSPYVIQDYNTRVSGCQVKIFPGRLDGNFVYHITVTKNDDSPANICKKTYNLPARYEFEHGQLLGHAYTYDSAYATTGDVAGMVGGMEQKGDGVALDFEVDSSGEYDLTFIYGKANDGPLPSDRCAGSALMTIDDTSEILRLPNTIRSEYSSSITKTYSFTKGKHTIRFEHNDGTFVLDSMLVYPHSDKKSITVFEDADRTTENLTSFLCVAPTDAYYTIVTDAEYLYVDGSARIRKANYIYLRKGFNYIDLEGKNRYLILEKSEYTENINRIYPSDMTLAETAQVFEGVLTGITSESGSAEFTYNSESSGAFRFTLSYSNNAEGGFHAYNVDLIEEYLTVTVNGQTQRIMCRNTYASDNFSTVTFNTELEAGINTVTLSNDGSVRFNNRTAVAPDIAYIDIAEITT